MVKPCSHRCGDMCTNPKQETQEPCVMLDARARDCRWWYAERRDERVVSAPWAPKPHAFVRPEPQAGPPRPKNLPRDLQRTKAKEKKQQIEKLEREGKIPSPFATLFTTPTSPEPKPSKGPYKR